MKSKIEDTLRDLSANDQLTTDTKTLYEVGRANGLTYKQVKDVFLIDSNKVARGKYDVSGMISGTMKKKIETAIENFAAVAEEAPAPKQNNRLNVSQKTIGDLDEVYVPSLDHTFVAWGDYSDIANVIKSRMFCPVFIAGLSGNGKTMMVEQACAKEKREYVRIQISPETDENDLIGGFRLINGETVFYKGPVIKAMERGAILLIDEIDRGSNKIMCLQGVLEGKPVLIKKIGEVIKPADGFNVIATANTKGRGSQDGRFTSAVVLDEAFLERFIVTIEQNYPDPAIEQRIVVGHMNRYKVCDYEFAERLVAWSNIIRKTFEAEGVDELISTRRLCHIVKTFAIFKDRTKAIDKCIARFDSDTRAAFIDLYTKIDATASTDTVKPITL